MCGIAGIIDNKISSDEIIKRLLNALNLIKYRGPDSTGTYVTNNVGFGTVRLEIENIKEGKQPKFISKYNIVAGFNGEIFNYKDIIKKYNLNENFSEIDVLIELYFRKKEIFINEISGQFAIYIYDIKNKKLFLARDQYGIRPIYYFANESSIYFGSEIKCIFNLAKKTFNISKSALKETCIFWSSVGDNSAFEKIKQLKPGFYLTFQNKEIKIKKFINETKKKFINLGSNFNIYNELKNSVRRQLQSEVGLACYLSGGIDSSALAMILQDFSKTKIDTFSVCFKNSEYDERKYQDKVSKFLKTNHHTLEIKEQDISQNFFNVINHTENFLFRTAPVPMYLLSKEVRKKNHKVIFTGEGADEILFGYDLFFENRIRKFWSRNINSKIRPTLLKRLYSYLPQFKNSRYFNLTKDFYYQTLKDKSNIFFSHLNRWSQYDYNSIFFNFNSISKFQILKNFETNLSENFSKKDDDSKAQEIEIKTLLSNYLLSSQGDRVCLANSVEARYPYLDDDFVKIIKNISPKLLARGIHSKSLFRESLKNRLPNEIIFREKFAYQAPEAHSFISQGYKSDLFLDFEKNMKNIEVYNYKNIKSLIEKIKHPFASKRLGFRENMVFIIALSVYCLTINSKKWNIC